MSLRELLLLIRLGQARMSISWYLHDIDRARSGLEKAYKAHDGAAMELYLMHNPPPHLPSFLKAQK